jgi:hypothetical protein
MALPQLSKLSSSEVSQACLWGLSFAGVCVLVGLGKVKPEVVEMMLMALIGGMRLFDRKDTK